MTCLAYRTLLWRLLDLTVDENMDGFIWVKSLILLTFLLPHTPFIADSFFL